MKRGGSQAGLTAQDDRRLVSGEGQPRPSHHTTSKRSTRAEPPDSPHPQSAPHHRFPRGRPTLRIDGADRSVEGFGGRKGREPGRGCRCPERSRGSSGGARCSVRRSCSAAGWSSIERTSSWVTGPPRAGAAARGCPDPRPTAETLGCSRTADESKAGGIAGRAALAPGTPAPVTSCALAGFVILIATVGRRHEASLDRARSAVVGRMGVRRIHGRGWPNEQPAGTRWWPWTGARFPAVPSPTPPERGSRCSAGA
jgi:hypothetical protein